MKNILLGMVLSVTVLLLNGCYTQIAVSNKQARIQPIIIVVPPPPPPGPYPQPNPPPPTPPNYPPSDPPQKEKIRKPEPPPKSSSDDVRNKLRNSGGRNNTGKRNRR